MKPDSDVPIRETDRLARWAAEEEPFKPEGHEDPDETRSSFKHDEDEIVHSRAYRRLAHKSQIVVKPEHQDHYRSRLTHTLEVKQIAQSIGFRLGLNVSLIDAIAFGHDIGHVPFGHAGEREIQRIIYDDVLPLLDLDKFSKENEDVVFEDGGRFDNGHHLFHHATNSVRTLERKMRDITEITKLGIQTHSWSPWQPEESIKFGTPTTYEAQAVSIADQVAGINHDTEDILSCEESEHPISLIRDELPEYISKNTELGFSKAQEIMDTWFLPSETEGSTRVNGWSRKRRIQTILNDVVDSSKQRLLSKGVSSWKDAVSPDNALCVDAENGTFLHGYEKYIRDEVIKKVSWFSTRDAIAAAVVRTAYNFFKFYGHGRLEDKPESLKNHIEWFQNSVKEEAYDRDTCLKNFTNCAKRGKEKTVTEIFHTLDYIAGMTDNHIMDVHNLVFQMFR